MNMGEIKKKSFHSLISLNTLLPVPVRRKILLFHTRLRISRRANMAKKVSVTMQLDHDVNERILAEAAREHQSAEVVVETLLRESLDRRVEERAYRAYYDERVAAGLADIRDGRVTPHNEVMDKLAALQAEAMRGK